MILKYRGLIWLKLLSIYFHDLIGFLSGDIVFSNILFFIDFKILHPIIHLKLILVCYKKNML